MGQGPAGPRVRDRAAPGGRQTGQRPPAGHGSGPQSHASHGEGSDGQVKEEGLASPVVRGRTCSLLGLLCSIAFKERGRGKI